MDKITTIKQSAKSILTGNIESAKNLINKEYPFKKLKPEGRSYTDKEKYEQFVREHFVRFYREIFMLMNYDESIRARQHIDGWKLVTSFSVRGFEWLGFSKELCYCK